MKIYPPGPKGALLYGSLRQFARHRLQFLTDCSENYGAIVHFRFLNRHGYLINDPQLIHEVFVEHPEAFHKSRLLKQNAGDLVGAGSLLIEGDEWKKRRKLIQPAFHHKRIANYAGTIVEHTRRMLDSWENGESRDIAAEMMRLTQNIIAKILFDKNVSGEVDDISRAITTGLNVLSSRLERPMARFFDWLPTVSNRAREESARKLTSVIMGIINERRASGEDKGDLLSMLLLARDEHGQGMSDKELHDEAMTLFIAGHETTANTLAWTFYLLAQNPAVTEKLAQEIDAVLGEREATFNDLARLPYSEMVIKEAMRLYPPAWVVTRYVVAPVTIGDYTFEPGEVLLMSQYAMQRKAQYFPEPQCFLPERWTEAFEKSLPRYAYFPFGAGPRVCTGNALAMMEARLVLASVLQRHTLALAPNQQIIPEPIITLRPRDGMRMRVGVREKEKAAAGAFQVSANPI